MTILKVGDQVVRVDGYSRGVVVAVIKDLDELNPFHQVVIRQRHSNSANPRDTVVTRDLDGYTPGKMEQYRFVKKPETKTVTRYYLHYAYHTCDPYTLIFDTEAGREKEVARWNCASKIVKLSEETITYTVPEKK